LAVLYEKIHSGIYNIRRAAYCFKYSKSNTWRERNWHFRAERIPQGKENSTDCGIRSGVVCCQHSIFAVATRHMSDQNNFKSQMKYALWW